MKTLAIFVLLFKSITLIGNDSIQNPIQFAIKPQYGLILAHSSKIEHLTYTNPFGVEAEMSWLMLKDKNYQQTSLKWKVQ